MTKRIFTKTTLEKAKKDFIELEFGIGDSDATGYDYEEPINYPPSFQKKFWKIWNKDTPKIIKQINKDNPEQNKFEIEIDLLGFADVDQTVRYGVYHE